MLNFSQLVTRTCKPNNLRDLLTTQKCFCNRFVAPSTAKVVEKRSKSSKNKKSVDENGKLKTKTTCLNCLKSGNSSRLSMQKELSDTGGVIPTPTSQTSSHHRHRSPRNVSQSYGSTAKLDRTFESLVGTSAEDRFEMDGVDSAGGESATIGGVTFTYMSYNILAQNLLESHPYLYFNHDPEHLTWKFRLSRLTKEILALQPDILCLQEVQQDHLATILKSLQQLNFDSVFKKKTGDKTDGCAILYNRAKFDLLEKHTVEFYQPNVKPLDRENVALIAKLCAKSQPESCFIASTTHLLYNPRRQDVRLAQIQLLLADLDHTSFRGYDESGQPRRYPIILSGDFNLKPRSAPYHLITQGSLTYHNLTQRTLMPSNGPNGYDESTCVGRTFLPTCLGITDHCQHFDVVRNKYKGKPRIQNTDKKRTLDENCANKSDGDDSNPTLFSTGELKHYLNLVSVYDHSKSEATTFQNHWITVDYIFYTQFFSPSVKSINDGYLKLLSRLKLPTVNQCYGNGLMLPNYYYGSDHLALSAKFFLQPPKISSTEGKLKTHL